MGQEIFLAGELFPDLRKKVADGILGG